MRLKGDKKLTITLVAAVLICLAAGPFVPGAAAGEDTRHHGVAVAWTSVPDPQAPQSFLPSVCTEDQRCIAAWLGPARLLSDTLVQDARGVWRH